MAQIYRPWAEHTVREVFDQVRKDLDRSGAATADQRTEIHRAGAAINFVQLRPPLASDQAEAETTLALTDVLQLQSAAFRQLLQEGKLPGTAKLITHARQVSPVTVRDRLRVWRASFMKRLPVPARGGLRGSKADSLARPAVTWGGEWLQVPARPSTAPDLGRPASTSPDRGHDKALPAPPRRQPLIGEDFANLAQVGALGTSGVTVRTAQIARMHSGAVVVDIAPGNPTMEGRRQPDISPPRSSSPPQGQKGQPSRR